MSHPITVAARQGVAGLASAVTFSLLVGLTILAMPGFKLATPDASVSVLSMPLSFSRFFARVNATSLYDEESTLSSEALLDRWSPYMAEASAHFGIPQAWIRAVMRRESGGRTVTPDDLPITSVAGAQGLMQVMPETYADARKTYALRADAFDPHDNVVAGAAYLQWLHKRYGFPAMFSAYNYGPGNYDRYLQGQASLPKETVDYLADITAHLEGTSRRTRSRR